AKALTITAPSIAAKTYDGTTTAGTLTLGTLSGFVGSETVTATGTAGALSSANAGSRTADVSYTLANGTNGGLASNYTLATTTGVSALVNAKALTISGTSLASREYDGTTTPGALTLGVVSGWVGSERLTVSGTAGALSSKNIRDTPTSTVTYALSGGTNGGLASNYVLADQVIGMTITPKALAIGGSFTATDKIYDGTTTAIIDTSGLTLSGKISGDVVTLNVSGATGSFASRNVARDANGAVTAQTVTLSTSGSLSGADASNYTFSASAPTASATITPAVLTIGTPTVSRAYDGTVILGSGAVTAGRLTGLVGGETLNVSGRGTDLSSRNAGSYTTTVSYTLADGSGLASNYTLADSVGVTATVTKRALTIAAPIVTRAYDGTVTVGSGAVSVGALGNLVAGETLRVTGQGTDLSGTDAGGAYMTTVSYTLADGGGLASNYTLADTAGVAAVITKRLLTIGAPTVARAYDGTVTVGSHAVTVGTLGNLVSGETLGVTARGTDLSGKDVGSYTTTISYTLADGAHGGKAANYTLADAAQVAVTIARRALTITAPSIAAKTYDATTHAGPVTAGTLGNLASGETLRVVATAGGLSSKDVGNRTANVSYALSDGTGLASNYSLADETISVTVNKANLTVAGVTVADKVYDAGLSASLSGGMVAALGNDVVTLSSAGATGMFATKNVGTAKSVTVSGYTLSGTDSGNYMLVQPTGLSASITPASLTLTGSLTALSKVYDATRSASVDTSGLALAGLLGADAVGLDLSGATGSFADKNAGTGKTVTLSTAGTLTGADAGNYVLASTAPTAIADITRATLAVTGVAASGKTYDATRTATVSGGAVSAFGGDQVTLLTAAASGTFADKNVGTGKAVTASGYAIIGADAGNYLLIQPTGLTADITKASLMVTGVTVADRVYDAGLSASLSGGMVSGLAGDMVVLGTGGAIGRFADKNVGSGKAVTVSGYTLSGADAGNYTLVQPAGLRASITPASLTLAGSLTARNKVYDATWTAVVDTSGLALAGLLGGDAVGLDTSGATGSFADKNAGTGKIVMLSTTGTLMGADAGNYILASTAPTTTADITRATLAVTGVTASGKTYDATRTATLSGGTVSGFGGDQVTLLTAAATGTFADKNVGTAKVVTASGYTLSGVDASNYTLAQPTGLSAGITPASLVVTDMTIASKTYDAGVGATLASGSVRPLGQDDVRLDMAGAEARFTDKNAGVGKAVRISGLTLTGADAGNYALVVPTGVTADIAPARLTITGASVEARAYDATTLTAMAGGSVKPLGNDVVMLDTARAIGTLDNKNVGIGKAVTVSGYTLAGPDAANYALVQPQGLTVDIAPAQLTISGVSALTKVYDGSTAVPLSGGVVTGLGPDTVFLVTTGAVANFADKNVGTGKAVTVSGYTLGGADAGNYRLIQPTGLTTSVTRLASVTWTGKGDGKSWFDPANWAGGAIPDKANVADVIVPASTTLSFDNAQTVLIDRLITSPDADKVPSSTDTVLNLLRGNLVVAKDLSVDTLVQQGGTISGTGNVTVLDSLKQTGGAIAVTGDVSIHQGAGVLETLSVSGRDVTLIGEQAVRVRDTVASRDLTIIAGGDAMLGGPTTVGRNLSVTAGRNGEGAITQDRYITVAGDAVLNAVGDITLTNSGNQFRGSATCNSKSGKVSGPCVGGGGAVRAVADDIIARAAAISSASGGALGGSRALAADPLAGGVQMPAFLTTTAPVTGTAGTTQALAGEPAKQAADGGAARMLSDTSIDAQADTTYITAGFDQKDESGVYRRVLPKTNLGSSVYYVGN
ncbi:beta strand repeat-containing protein, partial [Sphingomonas sp. NCPPB 2930]|uniref:beta strand repeat-containing protein n=1 Tax=Sphingomonas sp. NCPPB 2930 TaxID=3162788 RepID=UPI0036DA0E46